MCDVHKELDVVLVRASGKGTIRNNMKLPITKERLLELLEPFEGIIESENTKVLRISVLGSIIDVYPTTGTFKNIRTNYKGQGAKALTDYLSWLKTNKNSSKSNVETSETDDLMNRIADLENRLESLTARFKILDEVVKNII